MDAERLFCEQLWMTALARRTVLVLCFAAGYLAAAAGASNALAAGPHPFHISTAEMEYNAEEQRLEVALKLHSIDLENALSRQAGRRINVEKDDIKALVEKYLNQHFQIFAVETASKNAALKNEGAGDEPKQAKASSESNEGNPVPPAEWLIKGAEAAKKDASLRSKVNFVGQELEDSWLWVYFELKIPPKLLDKASGKQWGMRNSILMDAIRDQLNTVSIRAGSERHNLKFSRQVYLHELQSSWLEEPKSSGLKQESGS